MCFCAFIVFQLHGKYGDRRKFGKASCPELIWPGCNYPKNTIIFMIIFHIPCPWCLVIFIGFKFSHIHVKPTFPEKVAISLPDKLVRAYGNHEFSSLGKFLFWHPEELACVLFFPGEKIKHHVHIYYVNGLGGKNTYPSDTVRAYLGKIIATDMNLIDIRIIFLLCDIFSIPV